MESIRRRTLPLPLLLLLLAACNGSTVLTVDLDALPFIPAGQTQGEISIILGESFDAPDGDGVASDEIGLPEQVYQDLQRFALVVAGTFTTTGSPGPVTLELSLFLHNGTSAFDASNPIVRQVELQPDVEEAVEIEFELSEEVEPELLALVQTGSFRLGARIGTTGTGTGTVAYDIGALRVQLSVRADTFIPF